MHYEDEHVSVRLSTEGLRRAANDNAALLKASKLHEAAAASATVGIVVVLAAWFANALARGL